MADLVDYLRDKLNACTCGAYLVGRPLIGMYPVHYWTPGCPQHAEDPHAYDEANRQSFALIEAANAKALEAEFRRPWWRR